MSLRSFIQDHPAPLVWSWEASAFFLRKLRPVFAKLGLETSTKIVRVPEEVIKGLLFNCQDCGQCVLHYTGMTCPMNCPKKLRNGPCGGVRAGGYCEVIPTMRCVWTQAWERSRQSPEYAHEILLIQPPVDHRLQGSSAWANMVKGVDQQHPPAWQQPEEEQVEQAPV